MKLITGHSGEAHITAADDGAVNAVIFTNGKFVFDTGKKFAIEKLSDNAVRIYDGYAVNQGRKMGMERDDYEELVFENGMQNRKRADLIVVRYARDVNTGIESADLAVISGPSGSEYTDPEILHGDIIAGDIEDDMPLYRIRFNGLEMEGIDTLFEVFNKRLSSEDYTSVEKEKLKSVEKNANYYVHPTTNGYKHIPSGGSAGQILCRGKNGGEAVWDDLTADDVGALPSSGGTLTGNVQLPSKGGNWITGAMIANASIGISNKNSDSGYHPIIAGQTKENHVWNLGTLMDRMGFYGFRAGRTENNRDWAFDIDVYTGAVSSTGAITAPSFNGNATSATKATHDGDGNNIANTYVKKNEIVISDVDKIAYGSGAKTDSGTSVGKDTVSTGICSTALGIRANANGDYAVSIGHNCAASGRAAIAIGYYASAADNSVSIAGTAIGINAVAIGFGASTGNSAFSIAIGRASANHASAISIGDNAYSSGRYAVTVGQYAAASEYSVSIGYGTNAAGNNSVAIGYSAVVPSSSQNTIQLGGNSVSSLRCRVSITVTSDERDKTDVEQVDSSVLEFLERIRAVRYVFNHRGNYIDNERLSDEDREKLGAYGLCKYDREAHARGEKKGARKRIGFLAHEVQRALQESFGDASYFNLVNDNLYDLDPDGIPDDVESQLSMNYEGFIPIIIKGMQELLEKINKLERKAEG